jgi:hypothetical protein
MATKPIPAKTTTLTIARNHAVGVGGVTYLNGTFPCQAPPAKPTALSRTLTLVPVGTWVISPALTIIALPN